jgi:hypothetical protein
MTFVPVPGSPDPRLTAGEGAPPPVDPSILFRRVAQTGSHVTVSVYVGPDADHRAFSGKLTFRTTEWASLVAGRGPVGIEVESPDLYPLSPPGRP